MKAWRLVGAVVQGIVLGTLLVIALAKCAVASAGIVIFKYQGF